MLQERNMQNEMNTENEDRTWFLKSNNCAFGKSKEIIKKMSCDKYWKIQNKFLKRNCTCTHRNTQQTSSTKMRCHYISDRKSQWLGSNLTGELRHVLKENHKRYLGGRKEVRNELWGTSFSDLRRQAHWGRHTTWVILQTWGDTD